MGTAVIGTYFKTYQQALACKKKREAEWSNRVKWEIVVYPQGNLVISQGAARKCFPHLFPKKERGNRSDYKIIYNENERQKNDPR